MRAVPLLMTATIIPSDVPNLVVRDPAQRREEYLRATRFYLSLGFPVVLAENSGADLSEFRRLGSRLEVLQLGSGGEPTLGRGFLETRLVIDAAQCSEEISRAHGHFWKTTGRYIVHNMAHLVAKAQPGRDLYFNLRRHPELWADMWVYGASVRGMSLLEPNLGALVEEPAERSMYGMVMSLAEAGAAVSLRLPVEPRLSGTRGWDGRPYGDARQRAKWIIRSAARVLAPHLWL